MAAYELHLLRFEVKSFKLEGLMRMKKLNSALGKVVIGMLFCGNAMAASSEITDSAERLITPSNFSEADKAFDKALIQDPSDIKALFYKNLLKPLILQKGFLARIKPLALKEGYIADWQQKVDQIKNKKLQSFLLDGPQDIRKEEDLQNHTELIRKAYSDLRSFLKTNRTATLKLNFPVGAWPKNFKGLLEVSGSVDETQADYFKQISIDTADILGLEQAAAGTMLSLAIPSSYDLNGLVSVLTKADQQKLSSQETLNAIKSKDDLGKLKKQNVMNTIRELGPDVVVSAKWLVQYQDRLCPASLRKGRLVEKLCVYDKEKAIKNIKLLEQSLLGPVMMTFVVADRNGQDQEQKTQFDPFQISNNPAQDLKSYLPEQVDNCRRATSFLDKSLNGIFPSNDVESILVPNTVCEK